VRCFLAFDRGLLLAIYIYESEASLLHQRLFIFAGMCAEVSPQFVSIFAGRTFRSRVSELRFYNYAVLFYSCRQHPPFVLYRPQFNSVFIFVSVEKDSHSLVHL